MEKKTQVEPTGVRSVVGDKIGAADIFGRVHVLAKRKTVIKRRGFGNKPTQRLSPSGKFFLGVEIRDAKTAGVVAITAGKTESAGIVFEVEIKIVVAVGGRSRIGDLSR